MGPLLTAVGVLTGMRLVHGLDRLWLRPTFSCKLILATALDLALSRTLTLRVGAGGLGFVLWFAQA